MHQRGIIHRDLKPDNILLNSDKEGVLDVRVADLGLACKASVDEVLEHKCGTPSYIAPEVLAKTGYSFKSDLFSLGSIMFNLVTGRFLFYADSLTEMLRLNKECDLQCLQDPSIKLSPLGLDLMKRLLEKDPTRRPSAKDALKHPWFKED